MIGVEWDRNDSDILLVNVAYPLKSWQEVIEAVHAVSTAAKARNTPVFVIAELGSLSSKSIPAPGNNVPPLFEAISGTPDNLIVYAISSTPFVHLLPNSGLPPALVERVSAAKSPQDARQQIADYRAANGLSAPDSPHNTANQPEAYNDDISRGSAAGSRTHQSDQDR